MPPPVWTWGSSALFIVWGVSLWPIWLHGIYADSQWEDLTSKLCPLSQSAPMPSFYTKPGQSFTQKSPPTCKTCKCMDCVLAPTLFTWCLWDYIIQTLVYLCPRKISAKCIGEGVWLPRLSIQNEWKHVHIIAHLEPVWQTIGMRCYLCCKMPKFWPILVYKHQLMQSSG